MSHDVRIHHPGETAVCSQCARTVHDRWTAIPHHGEGAVEVKVWCRGCLLEHVGIEEETVAQVREEDAVSSACVTCGDKGTVPVSAADESAAMVEHGSVTLPLPNKPCPECASCATCGGKGAVVSEHSEAEGGETWEDCPDCPNCAKCAECEGTGETKTCGNCDESACLVLPGACDHSCWSCEGTGKVTA